MKRPIYSLLMSLAIPLSLTGCLAAQLPHVISQTQVSPYVLKGTVDFGTRKIQSTIGEVANAATVSLIDAGTGNTVGSSVTNASGAFVLTFSNFTPASGTPYALEAVKGLAVGGSPNRAGVSAARLRTLLYWNNGWQSLTNATPGTGIMVSSGTTALSILTSLKQAAGTTIDLSKLVNTVSGSAFNEAGTGLSNTNDFQPVLGLVSNAISLDQDPVGAIAFNHLNNTYALATGIPVISSVTPSIGAPGGTVTLKGAYLDALNGRNAFWFGTIPASTWSVTADRTTATVTIPASAYSAPFTLQQPDGVVQTLSPFYKLHGTVGTLAGNGAASYGDGMGINAQFNYPGGVVVDGSGNLYIADRWNHRIRKISTSGKVTTYAGTGVATSSDGPISTAQLNVPTSLYLDPNGNLFVSEGTRVRKITPGGMVSTLSDSNSNPLSFNTPWGMAMDANGNLFVAEELNHRIMKVTTAGVATVFAGSGVAGFAEGTGTAAKFYYPCCLVMDSQGNLFVADNSNHRIRKITPTGDVSTFAGSGIAGVQDGAGAGAKFNSPVGLAIDPSGNLYVGEEFGHVIRKVNPGGMVTTMAGTGVASFLDAASSSSQFNMAYGVGVDEGGSIYVADRLNHRIRVITP